MSAVKKLPCLSHYQLPSMDVVELTLDLGTMFSFVAQVKPKAAYVFYNITPVFFSSSSTYVILLLIHIVLFLLPSPPSFFAASCLPSSSSSSPSFSSATSLSPLLPSIDVLIVMCITWVLRYHQCAIAYFIRVDFIWLWKRHCMVTARLRKPNFECFYRDHGTDTVTARCGPFHTHTKILFHRIVELVTKGKLIPILACINILPLFLQQPNCVAEVVTFEKEQKIIIISNRKVERGEEVGCLVHDIEYSNYLQKYSALITNLSRTHHA